MINAWYKTHFPNLHVTFETRLVPIREIYSGKVRSRLLLVFAAAVVLLLVACINIANLLPSRFVTRSKEIAIRVTRVAIVLFFTAGLACYVPAKRAAQMNVISALHHE